MKFPKSMHAEGFYDHIDTTEPGHGPDAPKPVLRPGLKAGAKPFTARTLLREETGAVPHTTSAAPAMRTPAADAAARTATAAPRSGATSWIVGAGVGIALVGLAVVMSRNLASPETSMPPTAVVGQASPSPEDAQLQAAPPAAGPDVTASEPMPAVTPAPVIQPAVTQPAVSEPPVALAAGPKTEPPANVVRAAPPPAPAPKALAPQPEVLAQASPPPAQLREPALQPLAPPVVTPAPVVPPEAAPVTPPVAQQTPPVTPDPEDSGITVKVRLALAADTALSAVPIAVSTEHGVVKLEGQAPDVQARDRATVVAASTMGVKAVDNRLTLPPMASLDKVAGSGG
ncbi:BON domain-containing protein [Roseateles sp.]|uniref:BON domain-containing protein n=1 Tax=Roseateles sp. TaxID=1971397 RepID=UPI0039E984D8